MKFHRVVITVVHTKGGLPSGLCGGVAVRCEGGSGDASAARAEPPGEPSVEACRL